MADDDGQLTRAARALGEAEALLVSAGAGMGVDSGLPDFRGDAGFWKAYPPFAKLGLRFVDLASPRWFAEDPELAWGFYGHRLNLYRATSPHRGFATLLGWARRMPRGAFVFTSNVDGHFQRAGFDPLRVVECHGAIETSQCATPCGSTLFPSVEAVAVDDERLRAARPLPACPRCGALARPNVLMFGDGSWIGDRTDEQQARLHAWLAELAAARARLVVLELGAGTGVPTVRLASEAIARRPGATLVRVNPRESHAPPGAISLATGALAALEALAARVPFA
ncbi:MAG TPA: Sir2 family NAD-dependent protein deacetylase [Polyangia bacterium]|nr:Sir2 family NAD-dependent protein deacetylase [Polyangia bacterium]